MDSKHLWNRLGSNHKFQQIYSSLQLLFLVLFAALWLFTDSLDNLRFQWWWFLPTTLYWLIGGVGFARSYQRMHSSSNPKPIIDVLLKGTRLRWRKILLAAALLLSAYLHYDKHQALSFFLFAVGAQVLIWDVLAWRSFDYLQPIRFQLFANGIFYSEAGKLTFKDLKEVVLYEDGVKFYTYLRTSVRIYSKDISAAEWEHLAATLKEILHYQQDHYPDLQITYR